MVFYMNGSANLSENENNFFLHLRINASNLVTNLIFQYRNILYPLRGDHKTE